MKPVGPSPVFKQELQNDKVKVGDTITLTCQGEDPNIITNSMDQSLCLEADSRSAVQEVPRLL
jgi:hypothetical protein